jgi:hypothetical protein
MMESPAWGALTAPARRVVDRIVIEHMHHAGTMNGELVVTYDNFQAFGISRGAIKPAIEVAVKLGFIDITAIGLRSYGNARRPSSYALTWLPRNDGAPPSNRWNAIKSKEQAEAKVAGVHEMRKARKQESSLATALPADAFCEHPPTQDI